MTRCNATAELVDSSMQIIPGITLTCELEHWHTDPNLDGSLPGSRDLRHRFTFYWADVTTAELAEVLDPDESFDLEVDIAPDEVIAEQVAASVDNGDLVPDQCDEPGHAGCRTKLIDGEWFTNHHPADPMPEAARRCRVCGREVKPVGSRNSVQDWQHTQPMAYRHAVQL